MSIKKQPRGPTSKSLTVLASPQRPDPGSGQQSWHQRVAVAAYFRAEQRGFAPGHELDDWLAAEQETVHESGPVSEDDREQPVGRASS